MRPAELYRRGVVLPTDSLALVRLEAGDVTPEMAVVYLHIDEDQWQWVWPLMNDISRVCGVELNDHDTGAVDLDQLPRLVEHLRTRRFTHSQAADFGRELIALAERAQATRMPLFFVL